MTPYQRQTIVLWSVLVLGLIGGLVLWWLFPIASLVAAYLGSAGIITLWGYMRRYNSHIPDVVGEQMRALERQRSEAREALREREGQS